MIDILKKKMDYFLKMLTSWLLTETEKTKIMTKIAEKFLMRRRILDFLKKKIGTIHWKCTFSANREAEKQCDIANFHPTNYIEPGEKIRNSNWSNNCLEQSERLRYNHCSTNSRERSEWLKSRFGLLHHRWSQRIAFSSVEGKMYRLKALFNLLVN